MHIIIEHFLMNDSLVDNSLEYRKLLEMLTMGDALNDLNSKAEVVSCLGIGQIADY